MSFRTSPAVKGSPFELGRRSLWQDEGLPFVDVLTAEQMQQAFDAKGVSFGDADGTEEDDEIVYSPAVVWWALLSQMLFTGEQRACRAAVARVAAYYSLQGRDVSATNTGAYCRARAKLTEGVMRRLVDGTTFSLPDTAENQAESPPPTSQATGIGFPIVRAVALTSLVTGMVIAAACGPYAGKETGETALRRSLFAALQQGDVLLADRDDDRLPEHLEVREVEGQVTVPGFRTESLVVVTSLCDAREISRDDLAALDRQRWSVELHLRAIKSTMPLDVLRGKTPAMVRLELWTGLLADNLIRQSILQSARQADRKPCELSFTATLQFLASTWLTAAATPPAPNSTARSPLIALRGIHGGAHRVGNRPDRIEPRAIKRRPPPHDLLTQPRAEARADLLARRAA